jgi:nucleotide-binding universal stress UspA family protein
MYQKVLIPLDGSPLAECALSEAIHLAKGGFIGEVLLVNVTETYSAVFAENVDCSHMKNIQRENSRAYLDRTRKKLIAEGIQTKAVSLEGSPAQAIVSYAREKGADLIIIATHGYTGMKQLMFGSVALRVLHDAHAPVLLIRPETCR